MASVLKVLASPSSPPSLHQGKDTRDAVYVAAVPLRAAKGPAQMLMSAAYSLGSWDLQHFMVLVKPDPPQAPILVFDFQPQDPENVLVALAVVSGRNIPGVILKRKLQRMPRSRCWFVGYSNGNSIDVANRFNKEWSTSLVVGKHDCRHYTDGLVRCLTGEQCVLDSLRSGNNMQ
ncbi:uncharacterized protein [Typha latifolia]|uniref:uncharacterized protein n=1 Tax=Typha latifolia TaxID=4733 RepID=UPI003C2FEE1F